MKAKTKLISTIFAMCLVITLGVVGIFAVKTLNMSVGGNITFSADGLDLEVSEGVFKTTSGGDYSNITSQTEKLQGFVMDTNTKQSDIQSKIDSWAGLELALDSKGSAVLHFSVTNNMSTPLYVYISTDLGTNTNNNMDIIVSPNGAEITASATTNFTVTFDILDTSINAGLTGFNVVVSFSKENLVKTQNKLDANGQPTTEIDYYYVEMGTYNGQPVKWRYVADKNGIGYDGASAITSLGGYYILETPVLIQKAFLDAGKYDQSTNKHTTAGYENINANDYGLSDVRAYLKSDFLQKLGISENDAIYSMITGRTMTDLYSNINGMGGTATTSENLSYSLSLTGPESVANQTDKLWLMSYSEINTYFETVSEKKWGQSFAYYLRSRNTSLHGSIQVINSLGEKDTYYVKDAAHLRPAFKIA